MCGAPERTHPISAEARLGCFWVAGISTHGLGRAGVGIFVNGRVTPDGDHPLPPLSVRGLGFNAFVAGPYRLEGERSRVVTSPTVLPSNSARDSRTRGEGSWIGSLRSRQIPLGRRRCRHPCHESLRGTGGCADLFTARPVRSRCEHLPASQPTHVPRSPHGHNTKVIQILLRPALSGTYELRHHPFTDE